MDLDPTVDPEEGDLIRLPPDHLPNLEVTDDHQGDIRVSAEEEPGDRQREGNGARDSSTGPNPHSELEANLVKWGLSRPQVPVAVPSRRLCVRRSVLVSAELEGGDIVDPSVPGGGESEERC